MTLRDLRAFYLGVVVRMQYRTAPYHTAPLHIALQTGKVSWLDVSSVAARFGNGVHMYAFKVIHRELVVIHAACWSDDDCKKQLPARRQQLRRQVYTVRGLY